MKKKQLFKGQVITRTKVRNNILKIWDKTTHEDRYDWYLDAYKYAEYLAFMHLPDDPAGTEKVCGVIAALSPKINWEVNKRIAEEFIKTGDTWHYMMLKDKARRIIESDGTDAEILKILHGPKISAFFLNIRYPHKAIALTIDRHALSIILERKIAEDDYRSMTPTQYEFFSQCYRYTAAQLNINPLVLQSATWLVWRRM